MDMADITSELVLLAVLICVFVYSLLTKALPKTILTLPIIFMVIGYLFAVPLEMAAESETLDEGARLLAEITLVLVLFSDASHVRFKSLRRYFNVPVRILMAWRCLPFCKSCWGRWLASPRLGCGQSDGCCTRQRPDRRSRWRRRVSGVCFHNLNRVRDYWRKRLYRGLHRGHSFREHIPT